MRFRTECSKEKLCNKCNSHVNENKEFEAKLNPSKTQSPDEFGYMLPYFEQ